MPLFIAVGPELSFSGFGIRWTRAGLACRLRRLGRVVAGLVVGV
jgi:hypothetical protein